jgi:hypothetical protein
MLRPEDRLLAGLLSICSQNLLDKLLINHGAQLSGTGVKDVYWFAYGCQQCAIA